MSEGVRQEFGVETQDGNLLAAGITVRVEASLRERGLVTHPLPRRGLLALGDLQRTAEAGTQTSDRPCTPTGRPICRVRPANRPNESTNRSNESTTLQGEAAAWPAEIRPSAGAIRPHEYLELEDEFEDWRELGDEETELYLRLRRWGEPEENWD